MRSGEVGVDAEIVAAAAVGDGVIRDHVLIVAIPRREGEEQDGRTGEKFYIETAGSGGGWLDFDGEGRPMPNPSNGDIGADEEQAAKGAEIDNLPVIEPAKDGLDEMIGN